MSHPLIEANIALLHSARSLLDELNDSRMGPVQEPSAKSGLGAHLRHVTDHYTCLLRALEDGDSLVDYDQRGRSIEIEGSVRAAQDEIDSLVLRLRELDLDDPEQGIQVRMRTGSDERTHHGEPCRSSVGRELQFLVSHTIHHFALMEWVCAQIGVALPANFGVAPSTLNHQGSTERGT